MSDNLEFDSCCMLWFSAFSRATECLTFVFALTCLWAVDSKHGSFQENGSFRCSTEINPNPSWPQICSLLAGCWLTSSNVYVCTLFNDTFHLCPKYQRSLVTVLVWSSIVAPLNKWCIHARCALQSLQICFSFVPRRFKTLFVFWFNPKVGVVMTSPTY